MTSLNDLVSCLAKLESCLTDGEEAVRMQALLISVAPLTVHHGVLPVARPPQYMRRSPTHSTGAPATTRTQPAQSLTSLSRRLQAGGAGGWKRKRGDEVAVRAHGCHVEATNGGGRRPVSRAGRGGWCRIQPPFRHTTSRPSLSSLSSLRPSSRSPDLRATALGLRHPDPPRRFGAHRRAPAAFETSPALRLGPSVRCAGRRGGCSSAPPPATHRRRRLAEGALLASARWPSLSTPGAACATRWGPPAAVAISSERRLVCAPSWRPQNSASPSENARPDFPCSHHLNRSTSSEQRGCEY